MSPELREVSAAGREGGVAGSAPPKPAGRTADAPAVIGFIDRVQGTRVSGWALDQSDPELPVEVRILVDGEEAARVSADRFRPDLERVGLRSGRHAFEATLATAIEAGQAHRVQAFAQPGDGASVPLVNRPASPPRAPAEPGPAPESRQLLLEIRALRERIEVLAATGSEAPTTAGHGAGRALATLTELESLLPGVVERLDALDVLQVRLETAIGHLEARLPDEAGGGRAERGLRIAVGVLGVLSITSLLLGLRSLLG